MENSFVSYMMQISGLSPEAVGQRLRVVREARGMSQTDLARVTELSRKTVSEYEQGNYSNLVKRLPNMGRIADALEVTLPDLLGIDSVK